MRLMVETKGEETVWKPIGDLDIVGAQVLRRAKVDLATVPGPLVVDLAGVGFIDSAGLSALVGLARSGGVGRGEVRVVGPRRSVARVLEMTGVDRLLGIPTPSECR